MKGTPKTLKMHRSKCCLASLKISKPKENVKIGTTVYYVCSECKKACDVTVVTEKFTPSGERNKLDLTFK